MASVEECRQALRDLAARLDTNVDVPGHFDVDRTVACRVSDLGVAFHARLTGGRLVDIADGDDRTAKIAMTATSDDLVAVTQGRLDLMSAIASRRILMKANPFDLLRLRKLF